ncbi:MAG: Bug family tripartite tricarboxylate transporter substrate binding protein [Burkholderiales bacterium]
MPIKRNFFLSRLTQGCLVLPFVLAAAAPTASLAQAFPTKPLRIIIAAAPGVPTDTLGRGLVEPLGRALGQPIIIENRVGADGIIGTEACVRAAPDGHSLCGTASNVIVWNTVLRAKLPYDVLRDLQPVMHAAFFDSMLVAHPSVPVASVPQLLEYAKANPQKVNWAHFGINSTGYMYMEWLNRNRAANFYPVPYKTQPQNLNAMLAGEGHISLLSITNGGPHSRAGRLKPLAVTTSARLPAFPNVATFDEEGIKLPLRTWFGYHYQAAVPREIVQRMNAEMRKIFDTPAFRASIIDGIGLTANHGGIEEFDNYVRTQIKEVTALVASIGIKPE